MKLSIVVPIYNAEKYIHTCVDSLINQTYKDIEIVLVDDGSFDESSKICNEYAGKDARIKVIHKSNGGVSSARNCGLDIAKGDIISFIDADDWVEVDYCSKLLAGLKDGVDLVIGDYVQVYYDKKISPQILLNRCYSIAELKKDFKMPYEKFLLNTPWAKLYKRELIKDLHFDESIALGEDLLFNLAYLEKCKNITFIPEVIYNYNRTNEFSATKKYKEGYFEQSIKIYIAAKSFKYNGQDVKVYDEIDKRLCLNVLNFLQTICYCSNIENRKKIIKNWILNENVIHVCHGKYKLPFKYKIVVYFCRWRFISGIVLFYKVKKMLTKIFKKC